MSKIFFVEPKTGIVVETGIGYASTKHPSGKYITVKPKSQKEQDRLMKESERARIALIGYSEGGADNALLHSKEILENIRRISQEDGNNTIPEPKLLSLEELKQAANDLAKTNFEINIDGKAYESDLNTLTFGGVADFQTELERKGLTEEDLPFLNGELERLAPASNEQILMQQVRFRHMAGFMEKLKAGGWTSQITGKGSFNEQIILSAKNVIGDKALIILEADKQFTVKLETPGCSPDARKSLQDIIQRTYQQMGVETTGTCTDNSNLNHLDPNCVQLSDSDIEMDLKKETYPARR